MEKIAHLYSLESLQRVFVMNKIEEAIPVTVSYDPNRYVPSGSPGIVLKSSLTKDKNSKKKYSLLGEKIRYNSYGDENHRSVPIIFPFPTKVGNLIGLYTEINHKNLYPLPQKNLIVGHKIKTIKTFERNKLRDIGSYVAANAAITFVMPNLSNAFNFWTNIPNLCSQYKHVVFFNHSAGMNKRNSTTDEFIPFISFVDIPYCIPIFDHRKIDGMGVYCGFMYKNYHEKNRKAIIIDTLCFVMSNYQTNLLYLDGVTINTSTKISTDVLNYMLQAIKNEIHYRQLNSHDKLLRINKQPDKQYKIQDSKLAVKWYNTDLTAAISTSTTSWT